MASASTWAAGQSSQKGPPFQRGVGLLELRAGIEKVGLGLVYESGLGVGIWLFL